jgi:hypothetical protein
MQTKSVLTNSEDSQLCHTVKRRQPFPQKIQTQLDAGQIQGIAKVTQKSGRSHYGSPDHLLRGYFYRLGIKTQARAATEEEKYRFCLSQLETPERLLFYGPQ